MESSRGVEVFWNKTRSNWWPDWPKSAREGEAARTHKGGFERRFRWPEGLPVAGEGWGSSKLENLNLGVNKLRGSLCVSLGYLKNLRYLQLRINSIQGSIPPSIGNLSYLEALYLSANQMKGSLPESLGQLSFLAELDLSENSWEGIVTQSNFANLSSLKEISLYKLSSNIPLFSTLALIGFLLLNSTTSALDQANWVQIFPHGSEIKMS
ncbi:receptor-like protein 33 [Hevea brasiliensis]|uniref:receptor-like protein 33 n=1 Tax=Hevea brasiliensis TaxID=3981 RepID=UPI0025E5191F|nr:receptor-like protein 33 [Hevea brasiliensis]